MPAADERLYVATSLSDALAALADRGHSGAPLAGATWIMRAPLRKNGKIGSMSRFRRSRNCAMSTFSIPRSASDSASPTPN